MSVEWRAVPGYEGLYKVSSHGDVWSERRGRTMSLNLNRSGHLYVDLWLYGKRRQVGAHQLVARAFLGESNSPLVRHLDGDPSNNRVENLAYGDFRRNSSDAVRHGTHVNCERIARTHCKHGHELTPENTYTGAGYRVCRRCNADAQARRKARMEGDR